MSIISFDSYGKAWYLSLLMFTSLIQIFLTSAPIYGFASILIIFKKEQFYKQLCPTNFSSTNQTDVASQLMTCPDQDKALNLLFIIGIIFHSGVKFLIGYIVDKLGPQICQYIGCVFIALFSICLANAAEGREYLVIIGFVFLAIACSFLMLTTYQVVNIMFTKNKSLFLCILSGAGDSSTAVFTIFVVLYDKGISLRDISYVFGSITVIFIIIATWCLCPNFKEICAVIDSDVKKRLRTDTIARNQRSYIKYSQDLSASFHGTSSFTFYKRSIKKTFRDMSIDESYNSLEDSLSLSLGRNYSNSVFDIDTTVLAESPSLRQKIAYAQCNEKVKTPGWDQYSMTKLNNSTNTNEAVPLIKKRTISLFKKIKEDSLWEHIFSKLNFAFIYCFTICYVRSLYFVGNLDKYFDNITDKETGTIYIKYFGYALFFGILIGPLSGLLFLRRTKDEVKEEEQLKINNIKSLIIPCVLMIANVLAFTALQLFEKLYLSIPMFLLYMSASGLLWCFSTTFYGILFPPQFYCSMYGFLMVVSGTLSFLQYPILYMEQRIFHGYQQWTNLLFLLLVVSTFILPLYLWYVARTLTKAKQPLKTAEKRGLIA